MLTTPCTNHQLRNIGLHVSVFCGVNPESVSQESWLIEPYIATSHGGRNSLRYCVPVDEGRRERSDNVVDFLLIEIG